MAIRFSEHGPPFPDALVDDILEGKVVFLCGAGVSSPQLPGFKALAEKTYAALGAEMTPAERDAFERDRFEEVLGSLSRRMSDPRAVEAAVAGLLTVANPNLDHHATLLRISRNLAGRPTLVTTNFDTLFELAHAKTSGKAASTALSRAGQDLPPPGGAAFCGVIHLHGRLKDKSLRLSASPLVMTSAQYGDAYMRSAWASRFLFDLARCRTLVLVGYQAGDAPVRYFLNVLEADRERFDDVQDVYALDGYEGAPPQGGSQWDGVAVKPILFRKAASGDPYKPLWDDLAGLADLGDKPRGWRESQAEAILSEPVDAASQIQLDVIDWLYRGKRDLRDVAIRSVKDPRWFDHLHAQKLWDRQDAWVMSAWCAMDWTDTVRIDNAVAWLDRFGADFGRAIDQRIASRPPEDDLYFKVWRAIAVNPKPRRDELSTYSIGRRLKSAQRSDQDLRDAVRALTPHIAVEVPYKRTEKTDRATDRLSDLLHIKLDVHDRASLPELMDTVVELAPPGRIIEAATEALRATIESARDLDLIATGYDRVDEAVPTVERHGQNKYRNGVVFLVQLLSEAGRRLAGVDLPGTRAAAEIWRNLPSGIGRRLWLQALRHKDLFSSDETAHAILALTHDDFWSIQRRELILAMAERLGEADDILVAAIVDRVLEEGPKLYEDLGEPEKGQTDWRPLVRDRDIWLRLLAVRKAKRLTASGRAALADIQARNKGLSRDYDEKDLFSSYSTGVHYVSGDPEPFRKAGSPGRRLEVAKTLSTKWDPDAQHSWTAYCAVDPAGALETLASAPLSIDNAPLWIGLLSPLAWGQDDGKARKARHQTTLDVLDHLRGADDAFLEAVASYLVDLLPRARTAGLGDADDWWDRLWAAMEGSPPDDTDMDDGSRFYDVLINRPAGRLAEQLITEINARKTKTRKITPANRARLHRIMASDTQAGWLARGAAVREANFLYFIDPRGVASVLRPWLNRDDAQGRTLRAVLVGWSNLADTALAALKAPVLQGARESQASSPMASHVAAQLIRPLFRQAVARSPAPATLHESEVRLVFKQASASVLEGAASCLADWVGDSGRKPENAWRQAIGPIFKKVWPQERTYRKALYTRALAQMCVNAGGAFPEALEAVRHFLLPLEGDWESLHFMISSEAPEDFPESALELVWILYGPGFEGQAHDLREVLDRIAKSDPRLEIDRRLQWLSLRASDLN